MFSLPFNKIIMTQGTLSPRKTLDQQILPLLHHVHNHKIISYQQFKQGLLNSQDHTAIINQTLPVFASPPKIKNKREHNNQKLIAQRKPHLQQNMNFLTLSPKNKPFIGYKEKILFVNSTSKVKRHLADDINIKTMRQAMYQTRQVANRYEQFCRSLKQKEQYKIQQRKQQYTRQTHRLFSSQIGKAKEEANESFRTTTRKIFWVKNREAQQVKQYPEFLRIKCFSREDKK